MIEFKLPVLDSACYLRNTTPEEIVRYTEYLLNFSRMYGFSDYLESDTINHWNSISLQYSYA